MPGNEAVSAELMDTLMELQELPYLNSFSLAGGTCLAIRYGHRRSVDIDMFSRELIGIGGMMGIITEMENSFGVKRILSIQTINEENGDQYCFIRALIKKNDTHIKVELMQNVPLLDKMEVAEGIRVVSVRDIGLLKLSSLCSRQAKKDAYDLDLITDNDYSLEELMGSYEEKTNKFNRPEDKWVFDLDEPPNPIASPQVLLAFDKRDYKTVQSRPNHSNDLLDIVGAGKNYAAARASWRRKVREYLRDKGISMPGIKPVN